MAKEPNEHDDLNEFEAALASLAPRSDRLHRDRLMFLAGQASVEAGWAGSADVSTEDAAPATAPGISRRRRRIELAALGGMTALAASLLVALLVRPTQVVERIVEVPVASPQAAPVPPARSLAATSDEVPAPRPPVEMSRDGFLAMFLTPASPAASAEGTNHRQLRDLAFSLGLDAWPSPGRTAVAEDRADQTRPRTERDLLMDLLDQFEAPRPDGRGVFPESTSHPGAKS